MNEDQKNKDIAEIVSEAFIIEQLVEEKYDAFAPEERKKLRSSAKHLMKYADLLMKEGKSV